MRSVAKSGPSATSSSPPWPRAKTSGTPSTGSEIAPSGPITRSRPGRSVTRKPPSGRIAIPQGCSSPSATGSATSSTLGAHRGSPGLLGEGRREVRHVLRPLRHRIAGRRAGGGGSGRDQHGARGGQSVHGRPPSQPVALGTSPPAAASRHMRVSAERAGPCVRRRRGLRFWPLTFRGPPPIIATAARKDAHDDAPRHQGPRHHRSCPAPSGEGAPRRRPAAAQARLDPGQGADLRGLQAHPRHPAREPPRHRLRGGRLPERRRVLEPGPRHDDDHGRGLHPRLHLLQRRDRTAGRARRLRAGAGRGRGGEARARRTW